MTTKNEAKAKLKLTDDGLAGLLGLSRQAVQQWAGNKVLARPYQHILHLQYPRKFNKPR